MRNRFCRKRSSFSLFPSFSSLSHFSLSRFSLTQTITGYYWCVPSTSSLLSRATPTPPQLEANEGGGGARTREMELGTTTVGPQRDMMTSTLFSLPHPIDPAETLKSVVLHHGTFSLVPFHPSRFLETLLPTARVTRGGRTGSDWGSVAAPRIYFLYLPVALV
jgi:hypothetical protein